ncbi:hypothetical protein ACGFNX_38420 [Streptomyces sp. NPDC048723]|uniref:hypothetical protein n=1 Tax=Streptomyces sp. NPDC048723 TaxID=3365589 RepID=UPI0037134239
MDDPTIFDGAKLRVQIKQSREGADPVEAERDFSGLEVRLEDSTSSGARAGTYRTVTISHRAGGRAPRQVAGRAVGGTAQTLLSSR